MATNPYDDEDLKRRAQVGMLREPASDTMPIPPRVIPTQALPQREAPSVASTIAPVSGPAPSGWDAGNWADPNMHSVKYDAARLLYGKTKPSEVGSVVNSAAFQQRFPGSTFNGKDWIDFAGALADGDSGDPVHGIDYLKGANPETDSSEGAWWGAPEGNAAPTAAQAMSTVDPRADNSAIARIMAELTAASNQDESPAEREAIMAMLQGL